MSKKPFQVFLDTSVLSGAPRRDSAAFRVLEILAKNGFVVLHLSDVTVREFVSQQESALKKAIEKAQNALQDIQRRVPNGERRIATALQRTSDALTALHEKLACFAEEEFTDWLQSVRAVVHRPQPTHGDRVLDAYFTGSLPFKSKKNRSDFPDAFIFECLKDLTSEVERVHAVIADTNLRAAASTLEGVMVYENLDQLLTSPDFQARFRHTYLKYNLQLLRTYLQDNPSIFDDVIKHDLVDALSFEEVESPVIPDDNENAFIIAVDEAYNIELQSDDIAYYGEGYILVPFSAWVEVLGSYCIYKADYYTLDEERARRISISEHNDHYYDAEEDFTVQVTGTLRIVLGEEAFTSVPMDEPRLASALSAAEKKIDEIHDIEVLSLPEVTRGSRN